MKKLYAVVLSWLLVSAGFAQSQNESEPNNGFTQANAIELGRDIKAAIPPGDQDYFKVTIDKPGILNVAVESVPKELSVGVEIFSPTNVRLDAGTAGNGFNNYTDAIVCTPGTYYIRLYGNFSSSTEEFNLKVTLDASDIYECNNEFNTAKEVVIGQKLKIALNDENDSDYFKVNVTRPGILFARAENIPDDYGLTLQIYNSATRRLDSESAGNAINALVDQNVCEPGIYYIVVARNSFTTYNSKLIDVSIGLDTADVYECNNEFNAAKEVKSGQKIKIAMNDENDVDYFKINVTKPGTLYANAENVPSAYGVYVELYNAANQRLTAKSEGTGKNVFVDHNICTPGIYYVVVSRISFTTYDYTTFDLTVVHDTTDAYECNNAFSTAKDISIAKTIKATLADEEDVDFYKFSVPVRTTLIVKMTNIPEGLAPYIRVYNSTQNQILNSIASGEKSVVVNRNAYDPGTYYLRVDRGGNVYSYSPYTLEVARDTVLPPKLSADVLAVCPGADVKLTAAECLGTVRWSTGQTGVSITAKLTAVTTYTAVCEDGGRTSVPSLPLTITLKPVPAASASVTNNGQYYETQTIQLSSSGGGTYSWRGPNNYASTAQNPAIANAKVGMSGSYAVTVTNTDGCTATASANVTVVLITALDPDPAGIGIDISPNPASDVCTVKLLLKTAASAQINLLDANGRSVRQWSSDRVVRAHEAILSLSDLPPGIYLIRAVANDKRAVRKLLKQ